jgi:flagellar protein FlgJ
LGIAEQVRQQLDPATMYRSMHHAFSQEPLYARKSFFPSANQSPSFSDQQKFIKSLWPQAQKAAQALGVEPRLLIAQAALETGWGKHFAAPYNLFGIKADQNWHGPKNTQETVEFAGSIPMTKQADFRAYRSFEDSFLDYARFLRENPRYAKALANAANSESFLDSLAEAGYATDPHYANKIKAILKGELINGDFALDEHAHMPIS